jgi:hypothetical protein
MPVSIRISFASWPVAFCSHGSTPGFGRHFGQAARPAADTRLEKTSAAYFFPPRSLRSFTASVIGPHWSPTRPATRQNQSHPETPAPEARMRDLPFPHALVHHLGADLGGFGNRAALVVLVAVGGHEMLRKAGIQRATRRYSYTGSADTPRRPSCSDAGFETVIRRESSIGPYGGITQVLVA